MNILHNNLIVIAIVCFFLTMGCDSQLDEKSIPQKPVPFVFNPSVNLVAIDPGRFVRVTDMRQNITISKKFCVWSEHLQTKNPEQILSLPSSLFV